MLLSGLFFVGCGESPADKLTLNPDREVVDVYAGESENITFTIGNIQTALTLHLVLLLLTAQFHQPKVSTLNLKLSIKMAQKQPLK